MSIKHTEYPRLTIDDWRRHPGQLVFATDLAAAGIVRSYTAMNRAIRCNVDRNKVFRVRRRAIAEGFLVV
jgi:hypothetical protein